MILHVEAKMVSEYKRTLCAEEFAGNVEGFAADQYDLLTVEQLLCHDTGEATQEMSFPIDHNLHSLPC